MALCAGTGALRSEFKCNGTYDGGVERIRLRSTVTYAAGRNVTNLRSKLITERASCGARFCMRVKNVTNLRSKLITERASCAARFCMRVENVTNFAVERIKYVLSGYFMGCGRDTVGF